MYWFNSEYLEEFDILKRKTYVEIMGVTSTMLSYVFRGKTGCSTNFAKSLIAIRFNILLNDEKMNEYLEKYFTKLERRR